MLAARLGIAALAIVLVGGDPACTTPAPSDAIDDGTMLLQTSSEVTQGGKPKTMPKTKGAAKGAAKHASKGVHPIIPPDVLKKAMAEFIGMTLFVFIGCGTAMAVAKQEGYAWVLQVALAFGVAIAVLAYAIGHYSGGQMNCAVTLGMLISGHLSWYQACANFLAQMMGSLLGSWFTLVIFSTPKDSTTSCGRNAVEPDYTAWQALLGEFVGTFLLVFTVLETAVDKGSAQIRPEACLAIGFAVFLAHSVLIPIDGCSINPTRSFGPAVMAKCRYKRLERQFDKDMWIFWVGPLLGATFAAILYRWAF